MRRLPFCTARSFLNTLPSAAIPAFMPSAIIETVGGPPTSTGMPIGTAITTVVGGRLYYRGRDAEALAETESLEAVARLLRGGHGAALKKSERPAPPPGPSVQARAFAALAGRAAIEPPARSRSAIHLSVQAGEVLDAMADAKVVRAKDRTAWRRWLERHHATSPNVMLAVAKKGATRPVVGYAEAVEEALCFGWIDGIRKNIDEISYKIRFTPRRPRSIWSSVNIKRANELLEQGLMQPTGRKAFEARSENR